jgi:hypothetical protein
MRSSLKYCALALGIFCLPLKAFATGNLDCMISDKNLDFTFESLFSYSGSSPLFQSKVSFESRNPRTFAGLKKLDALPVIQQWFEGKDLRLQFYKETEGDAVPFAAVKLTIETVIGEDENSYSGTYRLEITPAVAPGKQSLPGTESETIKLEGPASCSAG